MAHLGSKWEIRCWALESNQEGVIVFKWQVGLPSGQWAESEILDKWCGDEPLYESFPSLFSISLSKNAWVSDVWNLVGDGDGWTPLFARAFNDWEIELVEHFLQKIQAFRVQREQVNRVFWTASKCGAFSVKSLYSILELRGSSLFLSNSIWRVRVPPKAAFFAWEASYVKS